MKKLMTYYIALIVFALVATACMIALKTGDSAHVQTTVTSILLVIAVICSTARMKEHSLIMMAIGLGVALGVIYLNSIVPLRIIAVFAAVAGALFVHAKMLHYVVRKTNENLNLKIAVPFSMPFAYVTFCIMYFLPLKIESWFQLAS